MQTSSTLGHNARKRCILEISKKFPMSSTDWDAYLSFTMREGQIKEPATELHNSEVPSHGPRLERFEAGERHSEGRKN